MIDVIGGVYREQCLHPRFDEIYGSGGRASSVIASLGGAVTLRSIFTQTSLNVCGARSKIEGFNIDPIYSGYLRDIFFSYTHPLSEPRYPRQVQEIGLPDIKSKYVLQYGMLEGDPVVFAESVVFDPQNKEGTRFFRTNGSKADRLAHVLNLREARSLTDFVGGNSTDLIAYCAEKSESNVVVLKMGPKGALVWDDGEIDLIPAFETPKVWSIGSGDAFSAAFAYFWLHEELGARESARYASLATAYYCSTGGFVTRDKIDNLDYGEVFLNESVRKGDHPKVYLAGPFFNLNQLWQIETTRNNLIEAGFDVLSPYHDIGRGSADEVVQKDLDAIKACNLVFAILDGLDSGTIYEVGYARALNKSVVVYSETESEQDLKMMVGSGCEIEDDYTTAIYKSFWLAGQS